MSNTDAEKAAEKWASRVAYGDLSDKYLPSAPGNNFDDYSCAYDSFLAGMEHAAPKWISVEERLPEEDQEVLVWSNTPQQVQIAVMYNGKLMTVHSELITSDLCIIYWMPLPDAPKEEK